MSFWCLLFLPLLFVFSPGPAFSQQFVRGLKVYGGKDLYGCTVNFLSVRYAYPDFCRSGGPQIQFVFTIGDQVLDNLRCLEERTGQTGGNLIIEVVSQQSSLAGRPFHLVCTGNFFPEGRANPFERTVYRKSFEYFIRDPATGQFLSHADGLAFWNGGFEIRDFLFEGIAPPPEAKGRTVAYESSEARFSFPVTWSGSDYDTRMDTNVSYREFNLSNSFFTKLSLFRAADWPAEKILYFYTDMINRLHLKSYPPVKMENEDYHILRRETKTWQGFPVEDLVVVNYLSDRREAAWLLRLIEVGRGERLAVFTYLRREQLEEQLAQMEVFYEHDFTIARK